MADPTQGDTLMARKRANAAKRKQQQQQQQQGPPVQSTGADSSGLTPPRGESPVPQRDAAGGDTQQPADGGCRLTDPAALVRCQLVVDPPPLRAPPDNWDEEERRVGPHGKTYTQREFVPLVGTAAEWESLPPVRTGEYFRKRQDNRGAGGAKVRQPSTEQAEQGATQAAEPFPFQVLGPRDYYCRPDLDEQSQRVVIESIRKQREEEQDRKACIEFNRKVQLAKFDVQRRARIELQLRSGLPVDPKLREAFRIEADQLTGHQGSPCAGLGAHGAHRARARRDAARHATQKSWLSSNELRMERNLAHREYCMTRLSERREQRHLLEASLGTHYARAKTQLLVGHGLGGTVSENAGRGGALAVSCPGFGDLYQSKAAAALARRAEEEGAAEKERLMGELDQFDAALFARIQGPRAPRQRGLPYSPSAPHKSIAAQPGDRRSRDAPGHRAPIVLSAAEREGADQGA